MIHSLNTQPLRSKYAIIIFIYIVTTLPPQQTYRTHSPKLRLLLVTNKTFTLLKIERVDDEKA